MEMQGCGTVGWNSDVWVKVTAVESIQLYTDKKHPVCKKR